MRRSEKGAALVEAAFVLPLVILLLLGIVDFGRAFLAEITLNNAVSEGALYAAQFPDDRDKTRQRVIDAGADLGLVPADIGVFCENIPAPSGPEHIRVHATVDVDMITPVGQWFGATVTLNAESIAINTQVPTPCDGD